MTEDEVAELTRLREVDGWTKARIARHLGVSSSAVEYHCLVGGIERAGHPPAPTPRRRDMVVHRNGHTVRLFDDAEDVRLLALEADGMSFSEIGRRLSRAPNSIRGRLATLARRDERAHSQ